MSNADSEAAATPEPAAPTAGLHLGKELQAAREAKGLNRQDVALQLRLDVGIIEALEKDDLERLPAMTFVRGYLRSYARLVGMDEARVKAAMPEAVVMARPVTGKRRGYRRSALAPRFPWGRWLVRSLLLAAFVLLLVVIFPKAMQLWNARQVGSTGDDAQTQLALPTLTQEQEDTSVQSQDRVSVLPLPAPIAQPPASADIDTGLGVEEQPQNGDAIPVEGSTANPVSAPVAAPESAGTQEALIEHEATTDKQVLVLQFAEDSWVELSDRDHRLLFDMMRAGSTKTLTGKPPFSVKLGNAQGVKVNYAGKAFDKSKYTRGNVARFRLP